MIFRIDLIRSPESGVRVPLRCAVGRHLEFIDFLKALN